MRTINFLRTIPISFLWVIGLNSALVVPVLADPPKKLSVAQFSKIINESPFTIKPTPPAPEATESPIERDWTLGSIRPNKDGYSVTLINKKDRKDRIRFIPGYSSGDFELLEVDQDPENSSNSRVKVRKGSVTAWLTYDEELVKIRPAVVAKTSTSKTDAKSSSRKKDESSSRSSSSRGYPKRK